MIGNKIKIWLKRIGLVSLIPLIVYSCSFYLKPVELELGTAAENIIGIWAGTNASIPTGWTRETTLDAKYTLGATTDANGGGTGGTTTHTHSSDEFGHSHTFTGGAAVGDQNYVLGLQTFSKKDHTHASKSGSATVITLDDTSNDPPYYSVIFAKSGGTNDFADDMIAFWDSADLPTNWEICDSDYSTPNLVNKFLKGATTGADSGATGGSSNSHTHASDHTHAAVASNAPSATQKDMASGNTFAPSATHTHSVSLTSGSGNVGNADGQPPFKKLLAIQNQTGGEDLPIGLIALWKGNNADIPTGWSRYTAMDDYFVKLTNVTGDIGATGGGDQHDHTASAHTHTASAGTGSVTSAETVLGIIANDSLTHTHTWTIGNATISVDYNDSKTNYPEYVTAIFIKYDGVAFGRRIWFLNKLDQIPIKEEKIINQLI